MAYNYNRYAELIRWTSLLAKINANYQGGSGHFFPRSAIVNVFFGENVGYEKSGSRPAVVVSNDSFNQTSGNIVVVPLTNVKNKTQKNKQLKLLKSQYLLQKSKYKLKYDSIVQCEDIRVVSKARIGDLIDFVDDNDMKNIERRLKYTLDL